MDQSKRTRRRHRSHQRSHDVFQVRRPWWDLQTASRRQTAVFGLVIGLLLGCLAGVAVTLVPRPNAAPSATLNVNETTGKTQIHLQGKPDIK